MPSDFDILLTPSRPFEQRGGEDHLGLLAFPGLQIPTDEVVEQLVGAAQLHVGPDHHRVPALEQRIEQLHHRDRAAGGVALGEVVPLQHLGDGGLAGQAQEPVGPERAEPLRIAAHLQPVRPEDQPGLGLVGDEVGLDLLGGQAGPGGRAAGGVADLGGEVAEDQHGGVAQVLELAELAEDDGEPEVDVGGRRVDARA